MKIIKTPRAYGKTTNLVKESARTGYTIVSINPMRCFEERIALNLGLRIPTPISHRDFIEKTYRGGDIKGFLIDDADVMLRNMTYLETKTITMSEYPSILDQ